jgi:hypothetical protein
LRGEKIALTEVILSVLRETLCEGNLKVEAEENEILVTAGPGDTK